MTALRVGFIGWDYFFTRALCRWLAARSDLHLIVWANRIPWPHRHRLAWARVAGRIARDARRKGVGSAIDEAAFYGLYLAFLRRREEERNRRLARAMEVGGGPIEKIAQVSPTRIDDLELMATLKTLRLDAIFAMCAPVYFPQALIDAARLGIFIWHEGITPEYRGVYSPFWALVHEDYDKIGYTLLRAGRRLDSGPVYVQGPVEGADFGRDWHSYLGHKSVVDSLPDVARLLQELQSNTHRPIERASATDGYFSYPTATALARIARRRFWNRLRDAVRRTFRGDRIRAG